MKKKIASLITSVGLAFGGIGVATVALAPAASASILCDRYGTCGDVYYNAGQRAALRTTTAWSATPWTAGQWTYKGRWAAGRDVDGFRIEPGCYGVNIDTWQRYSPGWHKINDHVNARINQYC